MLLKQLSIIPILFLLVMISFNPIPETNGQQVTNTLTILSTCGVHPDFFEHVAFGNGEVGDHSSYEEMKFTMGGSVPATLDVYAYDWFNPNDPTKVIIMNGENTRFTFDAAITDYDLMTPLNGTTVGSENEFVPITDSDDTDLDFLNGIQYSSYWQVLIELETSTYVGDIEQIITFVPMC
ncbi:MAG: hypothetical protein V3W20_09220 [Candidatus Neomarinimicrobiota bacterium]